MNFNTILDHLLRKWSHMAMTLASLAWYWIGMTKNLLNIAFCLSIYNTQRVNAICYFYILWGKEIVKDKRFKLYTCRHTFATYYYDWTKDIKEVARRLGHSKTDSVDHYIGICNDLKTQVGKGNLFDKALRQNNKKNYFGGKPKKRLSTKKGTISKIPSCWPVWARQDLNLRPTGYEPVAPPV